MTPLWCHKSQALTAGHSSSMATSVFSWVIAAGHSSSMATAVLSWLVAAGHSFMLGRILIIGATCYRTWSFLSCLPAQQESDRTITSSVACDRQVMMTVHRFLPRTVHRFLPRRWLMAGSLCYSTNSCPLSPPTLWNEPWWRVGHLLFFLNVCFLPPLNSRILTFVVGLNTRLHTTMDTCLWEVWCYANS